MIRFLLLISVLALSGVQANLFHHNWEVWAPVHDTQQVHFKVALKHQDYTARFMRPLLYRLVDPRSELYGQYLSAQEVIDRLAQVYVWTDGRGKPVVSNANVAKKEPSARAA